MPDDASILAERARMVDMLLEPKAEYPDVDYKRTVSWTEKAARVELIKDLIGCANAPKGGWIVLGVAEQDGAYSRVGVDAAVVATLESTKLSQAVNEYVDPPVVLDVFTPKRDVDGQERTFVVIYVHPFRRFPHIVKKDSSAFSRGALLVRNANKASAPIQTFEDMRELIERSVFARRDELLAGIQHVLQGARPTPEETVEIEPYWRSIGEDADLVRADERWDDQKLYYSFAAFPYESPKTRVALADLETTRAAARLGGGEYAYSFPLGVQQDIKHLDRRILQRAALFGALGGGMTQANWDSLWTHGLAFGMILSREDFFPEFAGRFSPVIQAQHVWLTLRYLARLYAEMKVGDRILIRFVFRRTGGRQLAGEKMLTFLSGACEAPSIELDPLVVATQELASDTRGLAIRVMRDVLYHFGVRDRSYAERFVAEAEKFEQRYVHAT